jgi:hypothetical protein
MKKILFFIALLPLLAPADEKRSANMVILNETGVKNLRIETVVVEEADFEESVFALGRIDVFPGRRAAISELHYGK